MSDEHCHSGKQLETPIRKRGGINKNKYVIEEELKMKF